MLGIDRVGIDLVELCAGGSCEYTNKKVKINNFLLIGLEMIWLEIIGLEIIGLDMTRLEKIRLEVIGLEMIGLEIIVYPQNLYEVTIYL